MERVGQPDRTHRCAATYALENIRPHSGDALNAIDRKLDNFSFRASSMTSDHIAYRALSRLAGRAMAALFWAVDFLHYGVCKLFQLGFSYTHKVQALGFCYLTARR